MTTSSNGAAPVQTSNLSKSFGQDENLVHALEGITLAAQRGEFLAVIKPCGDEETATKPK